MMTLQVAVAKVAKHAGSESGDTLEMIERPGGGFSFVLVDAEGSGRGAKSLSNMVATRALTLLKDGTRDGATARAVHDYLYTYRMGQVSANFNILSIDFVSNSILISRNNPTPFYMIDQDGLHTYDEPSMPIGLHAMTKPQITEVTVQPYTYIVLFTDGLLHAGEQYGEDMELGNYFAGFHPTAARSAQDITDDLLQRAMELERGVPNDDISIITVAALPENHQDGVRRLNVSFPMETSHQGSSAWADTE
jgi:serine phosphatase RsbU (regulator of sigma subunit)